MRMKPHHCFRKYNCLVVVSLIWLANIGSPIFVDSYLFPPSGHPAGRLPTINAAVGRYILHDQNSDHAVEDTRR